MTVGENIKKARKNAGLTQKELGKKLGITAATVSAFEKDKTNIKYSTIEKFAIALKVSVFDLSDNADALFHNYLSENTSLLEIGGQFFKLLLKDKGKTIECLQDIEFIPDYKGEPIEVEILSVFVDDELYYSIELRNLIEIMQDMLKYFKVSTRKYSVTDKQD